MSSVLILLIMVFGYYVVNISKPVSVQARRTRQTAPASQVSSLGTNVAQSATASSPQPTTTLNTSSSNLPGVNIGSTSSSSTITASAVPFPFANSLVGYWKLNGNAQSALGRDNGLSYGGINYVPGKFGQAAHFNGSSYIEIADRDYFSPSTFGQNMTVSFWFKPDTYNFTGINEGYVNFLGKANGPGADEWLFRVDNETAFDGFSRSERMNFYAYSPIGGLGTGSALNKACPLSTWTNVVGELNGTSAKLYINGQLVDSDLLSDYNIHMGNTTAPLRIGTSDKESFLQGSLSNVMIYNRALTDGEVSQLYGTDLSK